jgi:hypothetical protein
MARLRRADRRSFKVAISDGRGTGSVYVVDGYDREVSEVWFVEGVHTEAEVLTALREDARCSARARAVLDAFEKAVA